MWTLLLAFAAANDAPLEVKVDDPSVTAVLLDCGGESQMRASVSGGVAQFPQVPDTSCQVLMLRKTGVIDQPGKWECTADGCTQQDVHHKDIVNAAGRVNVVVPNLQPGATLELTCPDGYRRRSAVEQNTAIFEDVPDDRCTVLFKGGIPARYSPISEGTWYCQISGVTAVCSRRL